jgi:hypothetical protein
MPNIESQVRGSDVCHCDDVFEVDREAPLRDQVGDFRIASQRDNL